MNNYEDKWYYSITAIIILTVFMWPVGLTLLVMRIIKKNEKYQAINIVLGVAIGLLLIMGFAGIMSYTSSNDPSDLFLALFLFVTPALICAFCLYRRITKFKKYKPYLNYISVHKKIKLDDLSNKLNVDMATTNDMLTEIINKGLVKGFLTDKELILKTNSNSSDEDNNNYEPVTKVIKCKECGAKNTITVGETKECEYCGTVLQ